MPGDLQINASVTDVQTPSGADYQSTLNIIARARITDLSNCTPSPCSGPYGTPATAGDADFGAFGVSCVPNGITAVPPGSDCNIATSANAQVAGFVVSGDQKIWQVFRMRVTDYLGELFAQGGVFVP